MHYLLNFLSTSADKQKKTKLRRNTSLLYFLILSFSGYVMYQVYSTQLFMANIYKNYTAKIEKRISDVEPRILFLEKKIGDRNKMRKQTSFYFQETKRPGVWVARLADLSQSLPADLILTQIVYHAKDILNADDPDILVDGYMIIEGEDQDIFAVDNLRATLANSLPNSFTYSKLLVEKSHVYKEKEKLKLDFTLGYYQ